MRVKFDNTKPKLDRLSNHVIVAYLEDVEIIKPKMPVPSEIIEETETVFYIKENGVKIKADFITNLIEQNGEIGSDSVKFYL